MSGEDTEISFTYLDPRHGFNIELLYEGEVSAPTVSGTIIGMPQGLNRVILQQQTNKLSFVQTVFMAVVFLLGFTTNLWWFANWPIREKYLVIFPSAIVLILGMIAPVLMLFLLNFVGRTFWNPGVPQDLST
jgi:hypothetical protein